MADTRPITGMAQTVNTQDALLAQCESVRASNPSTVKGVGAELEIGFWKTLATLNAIPWGDARVTAMNAVAGKTFTARGGDLEHLFWTGN